METTQKLCVLCYMRHAKRAFTVRVDAVNKLRVRDLAYALRQRLQIDENEEVLWVCDRETGDALGADAWVCDGDAVMVRRVVKRTPAVWHVIGERAVSENGACVEKECVATTPRDHVGVVDVRWDAVTVAPGRSAWAARVRADWKGEWKVITGELPCEDAERDREAERRACEYARDMYDYEQLRSWRDESVLRHAYCLVRD